MLQTNRTTDRWTEPAVDDALAESFPASDPPAWNPGMGRPAAPGAAAVNVPRAYESERSMLQTLVSIAGAGGIALLVPFAILLVGLPVALIVRGLIEIVLWLFPALG